MKALYKCEECNYIWRQEPGMIYCPYCFNIWISWENYDEWSSWYKATKDCENKDWCIL